MATYVFHCASPVCNAQFSAPSRDELVDQITRHVQVKHRVPAPTRPIMQFLEANTITVTGGQSEGAR